MTEARYLTVRDVMAVLQCKEAYAYELIDRIGRAHLPGMVRVSSAKFYEFIEGRDRACGSTQGTHEGAAYGGRPGPSLTRSPAGPLRVGAALGAARGQRRKSSSHDGSESEPIPYTPPRTKRRSGKKPDASSGPAKAP